MTLQEIKRRLDEKREIRIQGLLKHRKETLEEFLVTFFTKWNDTHPTIYVDTNALQTEEGLRRSFGDLYQICKYYYPGTQIRTIRNLLFRDLFDGNEIPRFRSSYCQATKQRMWYVGEEEQRTEILNKSQKDEFGNTWDQTLEM